MLALLESRHCDQLAIDAGHAHAGDRPCPGNVRDMNGSTGAREREHVRGVDAIGAQHRGDDLGVLLEALGKERTHRPIDDAAGEYLVVALARLPFEEATGDLASGVRLFEVLAGQREEIESRPFLRGDGGHQNLAAPEGDEHCPMGLFGKTTRLQRELAVADHDGFTYEHGLMRSLARAGCCVQPNAGSARGFSLGSYERIPPSLVGRFARSEVEGQRLLRR